MGLKTVRQDWNRWGAEDPLWAVLTDGPDHREGGWNEGAFFETGRREIAATLELTRPPADGRALDFGCGVGRLTLALADHFREVVGVDIAATMIDRANTYIGSKNNVTYVLNEHADLSQFSDETFNFINASIVLQHMSPSLALGYLREFSRLLAPGGIVTFTLPTEPTRTLKGRLYRVLPRRVIWAYKRRRHGATMEMHAVPMSRLVLALESYGLHVDKVRAGDTGGPDWLAFRYVCTK